MLRRRRLACALLALLAPAVTVLPLSAAAESAGLASTQQCSREQPGGCSTGACFTIPLCDAARKGEAQRVGQLIADGADVDLQVKSGQTALIVAAWQGHTAVVEALVNAGAQLDLQNSDGVTALMAAVQKGHTTITKVLVEAGAQTVAREPKETVKAEGRGKGAAAGPAGSTITNGACSAIPLCAAAHDGELERAMETDRGRRRRGRAGQDRCDRADGGRQPRPHRNCGGTGQGRGAG
jgi:hypothetical protein